MFGYRLVDDEGVFFNASDILVAEFNTTKRTWNNETKEYDDITWGYNSKDCLSVFEDFVAGEESGDIKFDTTNLVRAGGSTYSCPATIDTLFIYG